MKISNVPGEFYFQALIGTNAGFKLCQCYHANLEDAVGTHGDNLSWPIEIYEDGTIYAPSEDELK